MLRLGLFFFSWHTTVLNAVAQTTNSITVGSFSAVVILLVKEESIF